ncbi:MAG: Type secretion system protein [Gemmatimonadetes bacterium]|nr:Type secretion system protein [Gemmatimonadota bacterium]
MSQLGIVTTKSTIQTQRRAGFTLIETIVTVGLISVLAAFVIPTVIQKASAADPVKVQNDLNAIRQGMETFAGDVKAGFPNQVRVLTSVPLTTNHLIDSTTLISAGQILIWNGPYLASTIGTNPMDSLATGYSGYIMNHIQRYDIINNAGEFYGGAGPTHFSANSTLFASLRIDGLTALQAAIINAMIDGVDDVNVGSGLLHAGANASGRFRFDPPVNGNVTAYFLASPITT